MRSLMRRVDSLREAVRPTYLRLRHSAAWAQYHLGIRDSEAKIERDAQRFWESKSRHLPQLAHWRGAGVFADDARWLAWGKGHLDLYCDFARMLGVPTSVQRIIEWGSGGGANAIHFAPFAREYVGVEVTQEPGRERSHARGGGHPQLRPRAHSHRCSGRGSVTNLWCV